MILYVSREARIRGFPRLSVRPVIRRPGLGCGPSIRARGSEPGEQEGAGGGAGGGGWARSLRLRRGCLRGRWAPREGGAFGSEKGARGCTVAPMGEEGSAGEGAKFLRRGSRAAVRPSAQGMGRGPAQDRGQGSPWPRAPAVALSCPAGPLRNEPRVVSGRHSNQHRCAVSATVGIPTG